MDACDGDQDVIPLRLADVDGWINPSAFKHTRQPDKRTGLCNGQRIQQCLQTEDRHGTKTLSICICKNGGIELTPLALTRRRQRVRCHSRSLTRRSQETPRPFRSRALRRCARVDFLRHRPDDLVDLFPAGRLPEGSAATALATPESPVPRLHILA